jgi:hypothetical protein
MKSPPFCHSFQWSAASRVTPKWRINTAGSKSMVDLYRNKSEKEHRMCIYQQNI